MKDPWVVSLHIGGSIFVGPIDGDEVCEMVGDQRQINAIKIAKCVNLHDELVTAVTNLLVGIEMADALDPKKVIDFAKEVLAKVESKEFEHPLESYAVKLANGQTVKLSGGK